VVPSPTTVGHDARLIDLLREVFECARTRHVYVVGPGRTLFGGVRLTGITGLLAAIEAPGESNSCTLFFESLNLLGGNMVGEVM